MEGNQELAIKLSSPFAWEILLMLWATATMGLLSIECQILGGAFRIVNRII
jgi:hypothetical protein